MRGFLYSSNRLFSAIIQLPQGPFVNLEKLYWSFIGRIDAEAKASIFWTPDVKNQLTGKDPHAGKG